MIRAVAILLLFGGTVRADEAAERAAIDKTIPAGFATRSVEFITPDVALAEGGGASMPAWDMVLKRSASGWKVAAFRSVLSRAALSESSQSRETSDRNAIRVLFAATAQRVESREIWCELECLQFSTVSSIGFVTPDVALVDGETRTGMIPAGYWMALVRREGAEWRVAVRRSLK